MKFTTALIPFVAYLVSFAAAAPAEAADAQPEGLDFPGHHDQCPPGTYQPHRGSRCIPNYCKYGSFTRDPACRGDFVARDGRDGRGDGRDHDRDDQHWHNGRCDNDYVPHRRHGRTCVWVGCYNEGQRRRDNGDHCCPTDVFN